MRETERFAMIAKLDAVERIAEMAQRLVPFAHDAEERAAREALSRIRKLLSEAEREARNLRWELEPPTPIRRAEIACVPVMPGAA
jgi:signal transduction histidine kinase